MAPDEDPLDDADLECVRNSFIELFNARDLDGIQDLLTDDVEFADDAIVGRSAVADVLAGLWLRTPEVLLTPAKLEEEPATVAWIRADREWTRSALISLDGDAGRIGVLEFCDTPDTVQRAVSDPPDPDELDEECDWPLVYEGEDPPDTIGNTGPVHPLDEW